MGYYSPLCLAESPSCLIFSVEVSGVETLPWIAGHETSLWQKGERDMLSEVEPPVSGALNLFSPNLCLKATSFSEGERQG